MKTKKIIKIFFLISLFLLANIVLPKKAKAGYYWEQNVGNYQINCTRTFYDTFWFNTAIRSPGLSLRNDTDPGNPQILAITWQNEGAGDPLIHGAREITIGASNAQWTCDQWRRNCSWSCSPICTASHQETQTCCDQWGRNCYPCPVTVCDQWYYGIFSTDLVFVGTRNSPDEPNLAPPDCRGYPYGANISVITNDPNYSAWTQPRLYWSSLNSAQKGWYVQVDDNSDFSSPVWERKCVDYEGCGDFWWNSVQTSALAQGNYYWRVAVCGEIPGQLCAWTGWAYGDGQIVVNPSPNIPILISPPNDIWINYNPVYQAQVSDPQGEKVRAYFEFNSGVPNGWGNQVDSNAISRYNPTTPDGTFQWRAYAQDTSGKTSNWSSYWTVKKDTVLPIASIDQPNGVTSSVNFLIVLNESDNSSGIWEGDVDYRVNSSLTEPAIEKLGSQYSNRHSLYPIEQGTTVGDYSNAWWEYSFYFPENKVYNAGAQTSNFDEELRDLDIKHHIKVYLDGVYKGDFYNPASTNPQLGWISLGNVSAGNHTLRFEWDNDWCGGCAGNWGDSNILIHKVWIDDWQNYANTIDNFIFNGSYDNTYEFRYRVKDRAGNWSAFSYDGSLTIRRAPTANSLNADANADFDYCIINGVAVKFSWQFEGYGTTQSAFKILIDEDPNFLSPIEIYQNPYNQSYYNLAGRLNFDTDYYWKLMVWNSDGIPSAWINGNKFKTPKHDYPYPEFSISPQKPTAKEVVTFNDESTCFISPNNQQLSCKNLPVRYQWDFDDDGEIDCDSNINPACRGNTTTTYSSNLPYTAVLYITDEMGTCSFSLPISVTYPLPKWIEIPPFNF